MADMLRSENQRYELSLTQMVKPEELHSHSVFTSVERLSETSYIIGSDLSADRLVEYLVQQHWGLNQFTPHQTSLEQMFIRLTLADTDTGNTGMDAAI